jgi:hypothetical protein
MIATIVLGVVAVIAVVKVGVDQQRSRSIPPVLSAAVAIERPGQTTAFGALSRDQANNLATLINRLGQAPNYGGCSLAAGFDDVVTFAASSGPIVVELTECSFVNISSHGHDWGANKYDWNGVLAPALRRDLPALPWSRLGASAS